MTPVTTTDHVDHERVLRSLLGQLRVVFQPVVELQSGVVVAHEALIRGPAGSEVESAVTLFERAAELDLHTDLDAYALELALTAAAESGRWRPEHGLFVNIGTANLHDDLPEQIEPFVVEAPRAASCVLDVGEAQLRSGPAGVLRRLRRFRELGWRVALTDVGRTPTSWSLIGIIEPDYVKLAPCVVDATADLPVERIAAAVKVAQEQIGSVVVAMGAETSLHAGRAWELGVQLGQGWWFGYPREVGEVVHSAPLPVPARPLGRATTQGDGMLDDRLRGAWRGIDERTVALLGQRLLTEAAGIAGESSVVVQLGDDLPPSSTFLESLSALGSRCGHLTVAAPAEQAGLLAGAQLIPAHDRGLLGGASVIAVLGPESALGMAVRMGAAGLEHVLTDELPVVAGLARWVLGGAW